MPRNHARVLTSIWADAQFCTLPADVQRLYLLLLSQPDLTPCGALPLVPSRWARLSPSTTPEDVTVALEALERERYIVVDHETSELVIRTFVVHDGGLGNPKMRGAIKSALCALHSDALRLAVVEVIPSPHQAEIVDAIADRLPIRLNAEVGGRWQGLGADPKPDICTQPPLVVVTSEIPAEEVAAPPSWVRASRVARDRAVSDVCAQTATLGVPDARATGGTDEEPRAVESG
jgi:hypothetical protein